MSSISRSRRRFLQTGLAGGAAFLGLGELPWLRQLTTLSAQQAAAGPARFRPEIEPLVRLIEDTPQERLIEEFAHRVRAGLSYREVMAAIMLAAVRNIRPGPVIGGKLHGALVVSSAHLASLASPPADRWLPVFWSLDNFKVHAARDVREGDWVMPALDDSRLPAPEQAQKALVAAMDSWDMEAADRAVAVWARQGDIETIYETLWRYGARDYRNIGHKIIYAANTYRTLDLIGREHAEGVLRSLVRALLVYRSNPRYHEPWQHTLTAARQVGKGWQKGRVDDGATRALLATFRQAATGEAVRFAARQLAQGVSPRSIWDAIFVFSAELVMQRPRIFSLHAQTTANAFHFAYRTTRDDQTRLQMLLQAAAYMPLFRDDNRDSRSGFRAHLDRRTDLRSMGIETLRPAISEGPKAQPAAILEATFATLGEDRKGAAEMLLGGLENGLDAQEVVAAARALVFLKGDESHDYKFSSAILEDYAHISPLWRGPFLASNIGLLRNSTESDNPLVKRIRSVLA